MGRGGDLRRRARRRSVRPAISGIAPQGNAPSTYARCGARRGRVNARNGCGCGRARGLRTRATGATGATLSALRADKDDRDAARRGLRAVSAVSRIDAAMRRACGHARRADLSSRAGGFAALGLPAHGHPRPAYLLSCWVPWATRKARCGALNSERAARAALQLYL